MVAQYPRISFLNINACIFWSSTTLTWVEMQRKSTHSLSYQLAFKLGKENFPPQDSLGRCTCHPSQTPLGQQAGGGGGPPPGQPWGRGLFSWHLPCSQAEGGVLGCGLQEPSWGAGLRAPSNVEGPGASSPYNRPITIAVFFT